MRYASGIGHRALGIGYRASGIGIGVHLSLKALVSLVYILVQIPLNPP
ncbi:hypothetical protein [Tychonema bourrellyi]|nr:hypothetical protein [Tychonema bourrellyi]